MNQRATILVVEDHEVTRRNLGIILRSEEYNVILAYDGKEAITRVLENLPSLILTNLNMPKLNGFDVAARVQQLAPEIPLLLMTGMITPQILQRAKQKGVRSVIVKPFDFEDVLKKIASALTSP